MATSGPDVGWAAFADASAHVFVDRLDDSVTVEGSDGHHLARVRRIRIGEHVTAGDGVGQWRRYRALAVARDHLELTADGARMLEPVLEPPLAVAFALTKGEKPETVVARLTELGVDRIVPVLAARSVVRWDERRATAASVRFERVAREAAMQARRARLPVVEAIVPIGAMTSRADLVLADPGGGPADAVPAGGTGGWTLLVGPEGGLSEEELGALVEVPRLALGPHVLRAETAAVAGAAVLTAARHPVHPAPPAGGHGG